MGSSDLRPDDDEQIREKKRQRKLQGAATHAKLESLRLTYS